MLPEEAIETFRDTPKLKDTENPVRNLLATGFSYPFGDGVVKKLVTLKKHDQIPQRVLEKFRADYVDDYDVDRFYNNGTFTGDAQGKWCVVSDPSIMTSDLSQLMFLVAIGNPTILVGAQPNDEGHASARWANVENMGPFYTVFDHNRDAFERIDMRPGQMMIVLPGVPFHVSNGTVLAVSPFEITTQKAKKGSRKRLPPGDKLAELNKAHDALLERISKLPPHIWNAEKESGANGKRQTADIADKKTLDQYKRALKTLTDNVAAAEAVDPDTVRATRARIAALQERVSIDNAPKTVAKLRDRLLVLEQKIESHGVMEVLGDLDKLESKIKDQCREVPKIEDIDDLPPKLLHNVDEGVHAIKKTSVYRDLRKPDLTDETDYAVAFRTVQEEVRRLTTLCKETGEGAFEEPFDAKKLFGCLEFLQNTAKTTPKAPKAPKGPKFVCSECQSPTKRQWGDTGMCGDCNIGAVQHACDEITTRWVQHKGVLDENATREKVEELITELDQLRAAFKRKKDAGVLARFKDKYGEVDALVPPLEEGQALVHDSSEEDDEDDDDDEEDVDDSFVVGSEHVSYEDNKRPRSEDDDDEEDEEDDDVIAEVPRKAKKARTDTGLAADALRAIARVRLPRFADDIAQAFATDDSDTVRSMIKRARKTKIVYAIDITVGALRPARYPIYFETALDAQRVADVESRHANVTCKINEIEL
jgi:hypothetical protein